MFAIKAGKEPPSKKETGAPREGAPIGILVEPETYLSSQTWSRCWFR